MFTHLLLWERDQRWHHKCNHAFCLLMRVRTSCNKIFPDPVPACMRTSLHCSCASTALSWNGRGEWFHLMRSLIYWPMLLRSLKVTPFQFAFFFSWALALDFPLAVLVEEFRWKSGIVSGVLARGNFYFLSRIMISDREFCQSKQYCLLSLSSCLSIPTTLWMKTSIFLMSIQNLKITLSQTMKKTTPAGKIQTFQITQLKVLCMKAHWMIVHQLFPLPVDW